MKKTNKNTSMGMLLGMCLGLSIGTSIGSMNGNIGIGSSMGMLVGMAIGLIFGYLKDQEVNNQIEEKNYTIKDIQKNEQQEDYTVILINRLGEESIVIIPKGQMETELFSKGDIVYLDEDGMIEQAYDKEDK